MSEEEKKELYKEFYNQNVKYPPRVSSGLITPGALKRFKKLSRMINKNSKTIADIGCRDHSFFQFLLNKRRFRKQFSRLIGYDIIEESIRFANEQNLPNCEFIVKDITTITEKALFDTVVCQEVIEHLTDKDFERTIRQLFDLAIYQLILTCPFNEPKPNVMKCMRFGINCRNHSSGHLQFHLTENTFLRILPKDCLSHKISFKKIRFRRIKQKTSKISWLRWFLANCLLFLTPRKKLLIVEFKKEVQDQ